MRGFLQILSSTPPQVTLTSPTQGQNLSDIVTFSATAHDASGIEKVEFLVDNQVVATVKSAPYSVTWDSGLVTNGTHVIKAKAYDNAKNSATTDGASVTTNNAARPPVAHAGSDITVVKGTNVTFDGTQSYAPSGTIVSWIWDNGLTGATPSKVYQTEGTYVVRLTVTDSNGLSAFDTVTVKVVDAIAWRDFREENVYFMMTDRFCDGDKTNNNIWGDEYMPGGEADMYKYDESKTGILTYYHGGDFKGVIQNIDYLKDMGFTAIWITPAVKQIEGRYFYDGSEGGDAYQASAFHGYWAYDFDKIDPHLHSSGKNSDGWKDFKDFADALHANGMKLMLDVVANHGHPGSPSAPSKWIQYKDAVIMDGQTFSYSNDPYKDPLDKAKGFFNYIGGYDIPGLIDFNERGPDGFDARVHLKNVYKRFIDAGVDAFRIDTVAYMTNEWWGEFADAMYNHAKSKGNDYFYMVGEAWCGRYDAIKRHSMDTTNSFHMLDMQLSTMDYPGQMSATFRDGGDYNLFNTITAGDAGMGLTKEGETWTGMFVDNHDVFRANGVFNEQQYKNALNYIYFFRGIPIVYYGTEAMYSWPGAHASTNKDDIVARWMLGQQGIDYVKNNKPPMYKHLKMLNEVRSASPCIQKGVQDNIEVSGDKAVFKRTYNGKTAFVGLSKGSGYTQSLTGVANGSYKLVSGANGSATTSSINVSNGSYSLVVPANGFAFIEP